ncbi:MFS transporter [Coraliomargarita sp. W4R72]
MKPLRSLQQPKHLPHTQTSSRPQPMHFGRFDYAAFLTFFAYAAGSVIVPVSLVELAHDLGFSLEDGGMTAGGALQIGRTVPMVFAMLLVGFIAGRWGNRATLGSSVLLMSAGIALCSIAPTYGILFCALVLAGFGEGVIEGLATPFVQDLHPKEPGRYINLTHSFWSVGVLATVLLSGGLLSLGVSWRMLTAVVALIGCAAAALILIPAKHGAHAVVHQPLSLKTVWAQALQILKFPRFWRFYAAMFLAGGGEFCLTFWSASHIRLNFEASAWAGGLGVACFALAMVIGRMASGYFIPQNGLRKLILIAAILGTLVCVLLPLSPNIWVFDGLLFLAGLATAPFWPSIQSYATHNMPKLDSTMLLILLSCAGVPGCGVFTYLMGAMSNQSGSLTMAFYLVPAAYALIAVLIASDRGVGAPLVTPAEHQS